MARRRVRSMVAVVGGLVATLVAGLLTASPASAGADTAAPVITAVRVPDSSLPVGSTFTVGWTATEDSELTSMTLRFERLYPGHGFGMVVRSSDVRVLRSGSITATVPQDEWNATYTLTRIEVADSVGNQATYLADGVVQRPPAVTAPAGHHLDFATTVLTLTGSTRDVTPPILTGLVSSPATIAQGAPAAITYSAVGVNPGQVELHVLDPKGRELRLSPDPGWTATRGTFSIKGERWGRYAVMSVILTDEHYNQASYGRDGTTLDLTTGVAGTHSVDLSRADVGVVPPAPYASARSRPRSAELRWHNSSDASAGTTGYRITVSPGGRVIDVPRTTSTTQKLVVGDLTNGVTYSFGIRARNAGGLGLTATARATPLISGNIMGVGDANADGRADLVGFRAGGSQETQLYRSAGYPFFRAPTRLSLIGDGRVFPSGPIYGRSAYLAVWQSGLLEGHVITKTGAAGLRTGNGPGWGDMRFVDGSGDFSGDGLPDVLAVTSSGGLRLYRGNGEGQFTAPRQVGSGWLSMVRFFVPGDMTGDRRADVMAIDSAGVLWIYPGNGRGGFLAKRRVGSGWSGMGAVFAARDLNGDGRADLGAVTMDGALRLYPGRGNGSFRSPTTIGHGWDAFL